MSYRLFPRAIDRQYEIWDYTADTWSTDSADNYIRNLHKTMQLAHANRHMRREVPEMRGTYYVRHERHRIFFRILDGEVLGVLTILHDSMNLPARLKEDVDRLS